MKNSTELERDAHKHLNTIAPDVGEAFMSMNATSKVAYQTSLVLQKSTIRQMGYMEAIGSRTSLAVAKAGFLMDDTRTFVGNLNKMAEYTTVNLNSALQHVDGLSLLLGAESQAITNGVLKNLDSSNDFMKWATIRMRDDRIDRSLDLVNKTLYNLERGTSYGANAANNIQKFTDTGRRGPLKIVTDFLW
jgi:hypothetical protein